MISDSQFKELQKEVRSNTIWNGVGYKVKRTATGTTLDIKGGKGGLASVHPFQAITSIPYTGGGATPTNQGLKFKIRNGYIIGPDQNNLMASNRTTTFLADNDCSDGFFCWAHLSFTTSESGEVSFTDFAYDTGLVVPDADAADTETGAAPANLYVPLFYVTTADNLIDSVTQLVDNSLNISVQVSDINGTAKTRTLVINGI